MKAKTENIVSISCYPLKNKVVVFICGHALHEAACTQSIAYDIAKQIGQKEIIQTVYASTPPRRHIMQVK